MKATKRVESFKVGRAEMGSIPITSTIRNATETVASDREWAYSSLHTCGEL